MAVTRTGHGCCFVSDFVYVIGGNGGHRSIEKIHIDHVTSPSQAWTTLKNELIVPSYMGSYVSYMSSIWIITGGYEEPNNMYVQVINTLDETVRMLDQPLPYPVRATTSVILNDSWYVFGGVGAYENGVIVYDSWMKAQLPTTHFPTAFPTTEPTEPTDFPSFQPTDIPSFQPTDIPSFQPTDIPSFQPTDIPSPESTDIPSPEPTAIPSQQWTVIDDPLLPRKDLSQASPAYNGSIFIMGGMRYPNQVTEYRILDNRMVDHGENATSINITGYYSTFWYQWDNSLYITDDYDYIFVYDMETTEFWKDPITNIRFPSHLNPSPPNGGKTSCMTGTNEYLIVSGGTTGEDLNHLIYFNHSWVLLLNTYTWSFGPQMSVARAWHGCCIISDFVYKIGGQGIGRSSELTIEKIQINHVTNSSQSWITLKTRLIEPSESGSYLPYLNSIWMIDGDLYSDSGNNKYVQVINTMDGTVRILDEQLPYHVAGATSVIVNDLWYIFGNNTDNWIKYKLPTTQFPTISSPSPEPTIPVQLTDEPEAMSTTIIVVIVACVLVLAFLLYYFRKKWMKPFKPTIKVKQEDQSLVKSPHDGNKDQTNIQNDDPNEAAFLLGKKEDKTAEMTLNQIKPKPQNDGSATTSKAQEDGENQINDDEMSLLLDKRTVEENKSNPPHVQANNDEVALDSPLSDKSGQNKGEIEAFLGSLGYERYVQAFRKAEFKTMDDLMEIQDKDDLKELGVAMAHRNRIKNAIKMHFDKQEEVNQVIECNDDEKTQYDNTCDSIKKDVTQGKEVENALVMFFGIGKYTPKNYEDLDDIIEDEECTRDVFENEFKYRFISNGDGKY
eukprot:908910_1